MEVSAGLREVALLDTTGEPTEDASGASGGVAEDIASVVEPSMLLV